MTWGEWVFTAAASLVLLVSTWAACWLWILEVG